MMRLRLSDEFDKPIADRELEALRLSVMNRFQEKIDLWAPGVVNGSATDYADYKKRSATISTWIDAFSKFDEEIRRFSIGDDVN